jgi:hypothetical protein
MPASSGGCRQRTTDPERRARAYAQSIVSQAQLEAGSGFGIGAGFTAVTSQVSVLSRVPQFIVEPSHVVVPSQSTVQVPAPQLNSASWQGAVPMQAIEHA